MVMPAVVMGRPARKLATRATFMHCSASGIAQPRMTSSISDLSSCGMRASAPLMAKAARSSGRVVRSVPRGVLPTAVRTADAMMTSFIGGTSGSNSQLQEDCFFHCGHFPCSEGCNPLLKAEFADRCQLVAHCLALLPVDLNNDLARVQAVGLWTERHNDEPGQYSSRRVVAENDGRERLLSLAPTGAAACK